MNADLSTDFPKTHFYARRWGTLEVSMIAGLFGLVVCLVVESVMSIQANRSSNCRYLLRGETLTAARRAVFRAIGLHLVSTLTLP